MKIHLTMWFRYNLIYVFTRCKVMLARFIRLLRERDLRNATSILHSMQLTPENFDNTDYWDRYPDVADGNIDAFVHFMTFGYKEGREGRFFDNNWYLTRYRDVRALTNNGYDHYVRYGRAESRDVRYMSVCQTYIDKRKVTYPSWLHAHAKELSAAATYQDAKLESHRASPVISILMPVYEPQLDHLEAAINSVLKQRYQHWQLCIADDASKNPSVRALLQKYAQNDSRIKIALRDKNGHISAASNSALEMADGDFIALLDHDDELADDALFWVSEAINEFPNADIIFSDEDKIDEKGRRFDPYFKSDFNYELFLAQNMINHLGVYRRKLVSEIGGFRLGYEGSQDHDLALRVLELTSHENVHHIPRILYHWRATVGSTALDSGEKNYAATAGLQAIKDHLARIGVPADVEIPYPKIGHYRVKYRLPKPLPLVSIIIPTRDKVELLKQCVDSILKLTTYSAFEIIIIDNGSVEKDTIAYFNKIKGKRVKIIRDDRDFNYPALNNAGVKSASGEFIVLMNNDIEIITPEWLEEMVSWGNRKDIGCVGARLWYPNDTLQHGGVILGIGGVAGHAHKHIAKGDFGYFCRAAHHQEFSAVTAACLLVRKTTYLEVGGLNTDFAVAFNDIDFCLKVRELGLKNIWTPYAEMYHHESASRGHEDTPDKKARFKKESELMQELWGEKLIKDSAYNPNLTLEHEDFSLAWPPRI